MTSFRWKRKVSDAVSKESAEKFQNITGCSEGYSEDAEEEENLWLNMAKRRKVLLLEDKVSKSKRLQMEGETLAEAERFWEAILKWDEALQLTPDDAVLHEMKAQSLMMLHEVFPAVQCAEKAVSLSPGWWVAYQTLGRAQLGQGEIKMAILNFSKAIHINPAEEELWEEDLKWAMSLWQQKQEMDQEVKAET